MSTGQVEDTLGGSPYVVTYGGYTAPPDAYALASITRGRKRPDARPDAATCVLVLASERLTQLPVTGDQVTVDLGPAARTYLGIAADHPAVPRFRGRITDLSATATGSVTGPARLQVIATGPRARLAQLRIGGVLAPAELDGARAARQLEDAAAVDPSLVIDVSDPGTVTVAARPGNTVTAGFLFDELAVSSGGELVEQRDGSLVWHDAEHRRNLVPVITTLRPEHVLTDSAKGAQGIAGLLNDLKLTYEGGSVQVVDPASADPVDGYGQAQLELATTLTNAADATTRASDLVGRWSVPRWRLEQLTVELLRTVPADLAADLVTLDFGQLVAVQGFPSSGPFTAAQLFVEGGTEQLSRSGWTLALAVSDYALTGAAPRWGDLATQTALRYRQPRGDSSWWEVTPPAGPTWADLAANEPDLTWLAAAGWDVLDAAAARWLDQPGDRSWADTDPTTWADYVG